MYRIWLKRISPLIILVIILAFFILWNDREEPSQCILCDNIPYHAPCLIDLSSGELGELIVYEPHATKVGEIAEQQEGGTLCFLDCAGLWAIRDTDTQITYVEIPRYTDWMQRSHFCKSCRRLLAGCYTKGYALVDMYTSGQPKVLPIKDGAAYTLRCYDVRITYDQTSQEYTITVTGNYRPPASE